MDDSEYHRLRQLIDEQYAQREREIAVVREADLAALNRICEIAGFTPTQGGQSDGRSTIRSESVTAIQSSGNEQQAEDKVDDEDQDDAGAATEPDATESPYQTIWNAIVDFDNDAVFNVRDVRIRLRELWPDRPTMSLNAITQVLRRYVRDEMIRVVSQGMGRRPTTYTFILTELSDAAE